MKKIIATARVKITIEVGLGDRWGDDCRVDQIHKQAGEEAVQYLHQLFSKDSNKVRIIGEPSVVAILAEEQ